MVGNRITELFERRPIPVDELLAALLEATSYAHESDLPAVLQLTHGSSPFDDHIAMPAISTLPCWGEQGLIALATIVETGHYRDVALQLLLHLAIGQRPSAKAITGVEPSWYHEVCYDVTPKLQSQAGDLIREFILDPRSMKRAIVIMNIGRMQSSARGDAKAVEYFWSLFTDTRLLLNKKTIDEFSTLLASAPDREEELHTFIVQHPIILDPAAVEVRSKHELGDDFITDFVLRRINNEYILVEIEKSTDRLFTRAGRLHSQLTEAVSQVIDFQRWIHDNLAYARSKLPGITRPGGLVIIGRREGLSPDNARVLDEENYSRRGHVRIITYDDLVDSAKAIYNNLKTRPLVYRGKKRESHLGDVV